MKTKKKLSTRGLFTLVMIELFTLVAMPNWVLAQGHTISYALTPGSYDGTGVTQRLAYSSTVNVPGALWLRLHFSSASLGDSYLLISSTRDNSKQILTSQSMRE